MQVLQEQKPALGGSVTTVQGLSTLLQTIPKPGQLVPDSTINGHHQTSHSQDLNCQNPARALRVVGGGLSSVCDPWTVASEPPRDGFTGVYESRHPPPGGRPEKFFR